MCHTRTVGIVQNAAHKQQMYRKVREYSKDNFFNSLLRLFYWRHSVMANTSCANEVKSMGEKMCDLSLCDKIQKNIDERCHAKGWSPGEPYIVYKEDGSICYCCCSCFAYDTPIAIGADAYKLIQEFEIGDTVLAAGTGLEWKPATVQFSSGIKPNTQESFMVYFRYKTSEGNPQELIVTEDHLFLMPNGKLLPANVLRAGDTLVRADGSQAIIDFAVSGSYTGGVHHIATGDYDGGSLDGHLLNSNGIVSADFSVQIRYITDNLDDSVLVADAGTRARIGSDEYLQQNVSAAANAFIGDPSVWPEGLRIYHRTNLINVPTDARSFITDDQAQDILDSGAPRRDFTNQPALQMVSYLFRVFKGFYPNAVYVLDWNNPMPNAYAWNSYGQDFVMLTGGMVRMYAMQTESLSLVLSHCLASLYGSDPENNPQPLYCVGPADYDGVGVYMSNVWRDQTFAQTFTLALQQIEKFFSYISEANRKEGKKCLRPSIDCRMVTFRAAASLMDLPMCANPNTQEFGIVSATPTSTQVSVLFNQPVNQETAETVANYSLIPAGEISAATVSVFNNTQVILDVPIEAGVKYMLTVENVTSADDQLISPTMNTASFTLGV